MALYPGLAATPYLEAKGARIAAMNQNRSRRGGKGVGEKEREGKCQRNGGPTRESRGKFEYSHIRIYVPFTIRMS